MVNKSAIASAIASLGLALGIASGQAVAQMPHEGMQHSESERTSQFERIEQPLWLKGAVTASGLGLIGLELWWFLLGKPQSRQHNSERNSSSPPTAGDRQLVLWRRSNS